MAAEFHARCCASAAPFVSLGVVQLAISLVSAPSARTAVAEAFADLAAGRVVDGDKMDEWIASWGTDDEKDPPACPD